MMKYMCKSFCALLILLASVSAGGSAEFQAENGQGERESAAAVTLDEIIVTASMNESKVFNSSLPVNVITRKEIERIVPGDMGDLFKYQPGLNVSYTSMGSVRPMIRGLYDERVLLMVDGIRLSEQRGGGDHALSVNPGQIERIEVVRGPGSVLYGSDAIGGVINIITRNSRRSSGEGTRLHGQMGVQFDSAAENKEGDAYIEGGVGKINFFAGGIYQDTDNVMTPEGELRHSFYDTCNYSSGMNYTGGNTFVSIWGYASSADIGNPLKNTFKESYFDNERHRFASAVLEQKNIAPFLTKIRIDGAFQRHNRHFHLLNPADVAVDIYLDIDTWNLHPHFVMQIGDAQRITAGAQFFYEEVTSSREMSTGPISGVIPDCTRLGMGYFIQDEVTFTKRFSAVLGVRHDRIVSESEPGEDEVLYGHPIGENREIDENTSGSIGLLFTVVKDRLNFTANAGRAFRAPTLLERYFYGTHTEGEDRGNPDLDPEVSLNLDAGFKLNLPGFWMTVSGFRNRIDNYIVKYNTGQTGSSGAIFQFRNVDSAVIYGAEAEAEMVLAWGFTVFGNVTWLRSENSDTGEALPYMPPLSGTYGVRYSRDYRSLNFWSELAVHSAARQDRIDETSETETPGYTVCDVRLGINYTELVSITGFVKNITNKSYHDHLSRVSHMDEQPERSIGGSLRVRF
jgi:hemoglobin/transferrin/lactoferrin receptor protein